jgi:hypothetical protein
MREEFYIKGIQGAHDRIQKVENRLGAIYRVLEEIIGKELLRGQALHKVLMDKAIFTDVELKTALEQLVEASKADLKKMEEEAASAKAKAVELLVPQGANLTPPIEGPAPAPTPEASVPPTEDSNG